MELHEATVEATVSHDMEWNEITVMPVADLQMGAEGCDTETFKRTIDYGMKHSAYFVGLGDMVDVASPSNRAILRGNKLYDSVLDAMEDAANSAITKVVHMLKDTKGRWLGMLEGDHYYQFDDGKTTDVILAQEMGCPFLGSCAFVRLKFPRPISTSTATCTLWLHHGSGGGIKASAPLNKLENLVAAFDADIYLMGHQHKISAAPIHQVYMTPNSGRLAFRSKVIASTGGFLRGYNSGRNMRGGYIEKKMLKPVSLGSPLIKIRPLRRNYGDSLDIRVEV